MPQLGTETFVVTKEPLNRAPFYYSDPSAAEKSNDKMNFMLTSTSPQFDNKLKLLNGKFKKMALISNRCDINVSVFSLSLCER